MFIEAVVLGLLVGGLRGGRSENLADLHLRGGALLVCAFLLQMLPALFGRVGFIARYGHILSFLMMLLAVAVIGMNIGRKGFWAIGLGFFLNLIPMLAHGLKMPVLLSSLKLAGRAEMVESIANGAVMNYAGVLQPDGITDWLGKVIPLPGFYPFAQIISIGDIVISVGLFLFVFGEMTSSRSFKAKSRMFQMPYGR